MPTNRWDMIPELVAHVFARSLGKACGWFFIEYSTKCLLPHTAAPPGARSLTCGRPFCSLQNTHICSARAPGRRQVRREPCIAFSALSRLPMPKPFRCSLACSSRFRAASSAAGRHVASDKEHGLQRQQQRASAEQRARPHVLAIEDGDGDFEHEEHATNTRLTKCSMEVRVGSHGEHQVLLVVQRDAV